MCVDPATGALLLASSAMGMGGSAMQQNDARNNANSKADARNSVLRQSLERQRKLGAEARTMFDSRMMDYDQPAQEKSLAGAQDARTADITKNITPLNPSPPMALSGSAPEVVKSEIAKRMLSSFNDATARAKAMGKLGGYGDNWMGNNMGVADTARRVGTINNFSRGDAALLPAEQDFAAISAPQSNSIWGPILSAGGNLVAGAAGRGFNPFGGAAKAAGAPLDILAAGGISR